MYSYGIVYLSVRVAHPYLQYEWISREWIFHAGGHGWKNECCSFATSLREDENLLGEKHTGVVTKQVTFVGQGEVCRHSVPGNVSIYSVVYCSCNISRCLTHSRPAQVTSWFLHVAVIASFPLWCLLGTRYVPGEVGLLCENSAHWFLGAALWVKVMWKGLSATGLQHQLSSFGCLKCHGFRILMPKSCSIWKISLLEDVSIPKSFTVRPVLWSAVVSCWWHEKRVRYIHSQGNVSACNQLENVMFITSGFLNQSPTLSLLINLTLRFAQVCFCFNNICTILWRCKVLC